MRIELGSLIVLGGVFACLVSPVLGDGFPAADDGSRILLQGQVTSDNLPLPETVVVKAAYVHARSKYSSQLFDTQGEELPPEIPVDEHGRFTLDRKQQPMMIFCESADGELAGVSQVSSDTKEIAIELRPVTTVQGRLVSRKTGQPLAGRRLIFGVHFYWPGKDTFEGSLFGKTVTTDEDGSFAIPGLVANQRYDLDELQIEKRDIGTVVSIHELGTVLTGSDPVTEIGDWGQLRALFASDLPTSELLNEATREARLSRGGVLVIVASSSDPAIRLFDNLRNDDEEIRNALLDFEVVFVDPETEPQSSVDELSQRLDLPISREEAGVHFCFLDGDGVVKEKGHFAAADNSEFPRQVFIDARARCVREYPSAKELFASALQQAREQNKMILLQESGRSCGACRLMSKFMESTRQQWSQDFVWVTIDQRWPDAGEVVQKLRGDNRTSIPWYAVLDSQGQVQATSYDQDGNNKGFPGAENSRDHFRSILENHSVRMSVNDIETMLRELDK